MEAHGEEIDQHEAEPEAGDGLAEHGRAHAEVVEEGAPACRGEDADGNGEDEGEKEGHPPELQGGGQPLQHEAEGVTPIAERFAEVAAHRLRHEARVLHGEGIVEAQALPRLVDVLGLDVHGEEQEHGIPGQPHEEEHHGEGQEHHERGLAETGEEVAAHPDECTRTVRGHAEEGRIDRRPHMMVI